MQKHNSPTTTILPAGTVSTATNTPAKVVKAGGYGATAVAHLNITAISGTSTPTLTVKFQESVDQTNWIDVPSGAFSAATATGLSRLLLSNFGPYLRVVETISGTTPSFTHSLVISGVA